MLPVLSALGLAALASLGSSPALAMPQEAAPEIASFAAQSRPPLTLSSLCTNPREATVALWDGARLTWGNDAYDCDGERFCSFTLGDGNPGRFVTEGHMQIDLRCGAETGRGSLQLSCDGGVCNPEQLTWDDAQGARQPYFSGWAPGADGVVPAFLDVLHREPADLLAEPAPLTAEVKLLALRLADVVASCGELPCRDVPWRDAGEAAAVIATLGVQVTSIDRDTWQEAGWTAHFTSAAGLSGELDCFEFSGECDLHAQACSLTVRRGTETLVSYAEPYTDQYEELDPQWVHEARVGGLVIQTGGDEGLGYLHRWPWPAAPRRAE